MLKTGWTPELRQAYFSWFPKAGQFKGGNSFRGFMANIKRDAHRQPERRREGRAQADPGRRGRPRRRGRRDRPSGRSSRNGRSTSWCRWSRSGLKGRDFDRGRALFAAAKCFACHRFNDEGGGLGPDLSGVAGRFSARDLLESIVVPSKTISDQYEAVIDRHDRRPRRHRPDRQPATATT